MIQWIDGVVEADVLSFLNYDCSDWKARKNQSFCR
jgi:hypothetical protein